ncbi:MAG: hypothetical protein SGJ18_00975 [Pseudomonadota bacterium]|nr:hypothetical protein [Pseudomonadota bacterium]
MKYESGQNIPDHVADALRLTGKVGFLSHALWRDCFAEKYNLRWQRRQLRNLVKEKILRDYAKTLNNCYFVLSIKGRRLLEDENRNVVKPSPLSQLLHDENVARSLINLDKSGLLVGWKTENELKSTQGKVFQLNRDARNKKYPDAVLKINTHGIERTIAIEYERTRKSAGRYKKILWLYSRSMDFGMVVFICENKSIETAIREKLKYMQLPDLLKRVAFVQSAKWQIDPANAPLELGNKVFTLKEICRNKKAV